MTALLASLWHGAGIRRKVPRRFPSDSDTQDFSIESMDGRLLTLLADRCREDEVGAGQISHRPARQ